ncbi:hypothetical protein TPHA_0B01200 [Tetrapisispora phaffii CBS 4417]|uniref:Nucleosome assembly protein I n=1 Tax=Tetrapisispora phaffii (strain ATCC 24235 / CBS 4417 / NBRC 1672 / NRRL Y-8282 / UCD 70-5) TaxID=1071381 RepID=G8BP61_TETPH|nr:hypothetical protein TPHA_0B01200 [Tetrapisispora phaffii CBS 4417]CCE61792.1 hypothetical protein TPHA_0B01200 [Tetrapisispora phaffii CBS 4417]
MTDPIKTNKPKSSMKIENAPTPHNTPANNFDFLKNGNPMKKSGSGNASAKQGAAQSVNEEDIKSALSANQPLLLQSIQEKLGSLVGADSGYLESLPKNVKDRIFALKSIQEDLFQLEKDFQIELFDLEKKFIAKYKPLHDSRASIINGESKPTDEQIEKGKELAAPEEEEEAEEEEDESLVGIPSFWLTALENLPIVADTITDRDAEVLDFLTNVRLEYLDNGKPGFKLIFDFNAEENPFFTNSSITKTYYYQSELGYSGDFIYDHADGEEIDWVDNESNVTVQIEKRKQRNKTTKQVRTIEKITPIESFFNFFDPPRMKEHIHNHGKGEECDDEEDEEELADLEERLALDYSIGEQIKDKLIPRAVDWFTGSALEFEYDNEEMGDEDDNEEDYDEDFDEDDFDEEEEDDFANTKKEQPPECKQS